MSTYLNNSAMVVAFAVFVVLVLGLLNMARAGSGNLSQSFMRWRVGLQFVAVVLLVLAAWITRA